MGKRAMQELRDLSMTNFRRGIFRFKIFGKVVVQIKRMHDEEFAVMIHDPVSKTHVEILRISGVLDPHFI